MSNYTKKPISIAQYSMMRGMIDFSNAKQFNLFEGGYSFLVTVTRPRYIEKLAENDATVSDSLNLFCYILENEFRGLDGIEDLTADALEFTDGISTINTIGKVNQQSASEISMTFTERSGAAITGFIDYYLKGVKDPRTQARTYHGLIKEGKLAGGFENEIFNFLYLVTDNTLLALERAYMILNAWPTKAPTSTLYNTTKGEIDKKEIDLTFQCFVQDGDEVDRLGLKMLAYINDTKAVANYAPLYDTTGRAQAAANEVTTYHDNQVVLSSVDYDFNVYEDIEGIMK